MFEEAKARWELMSDENRAKVVDDLLRPKPRCTNCHLLYAGGIRFLTTVCEPQNYDENNNCPFFKPADENTRATENKTRL